MSHHLVTTLLAEMHAYDASTLPNVIKDLNLPIPQEKSYSANAKFTLLFIQIFSVF